MYFCWNIWRSFVRFGEHDTRTTESVQVDVKVSSFKSHEEYDGLTNDIAIVYLKHDVPFTGELKIIIWYFREELRILSEMWTFFGINFIENIRPICLPVDEPIRSRKFVGDNPFVGKLIRSCPLPLFPRPMNTIFNTCSGLGSRKGRWSENITRFDAIAGSSDW